MARTYRFPAKTLFLIPTRQLPADILAGFGPGWLETLWIEAIMPL
jgi:hypothetical protein